MNAHMRQLYKTSGDPYGVVVLLDLFLTNQRLPLRIKFYSRLQVPSVQTARIKL